MKEDILENSALEITREYLLKRTHLAVLGQQYHAAPSTVHRRINKWLSEGRFELVDKSDHQAVSRVIEVDTELEEKLVQKTKIWQARIVKVSGTEKAYTEQYMETAGNQYTQMAWRAGDELHESLGEVAAELILNRLKRNMTIGLSSGRGVGFATMKLGEIAQKMPSRVNGFENTRIISMCGGAHVGTWSIPSHRPLDADENVFALASILKVPVNNLVYNDGPTSIDPEDHRLMPDFKHDLDLAVIGLGQLNTGHHFFRYIDTAQLRAVAEPLHRIKSWQAGNPVLVEKVAEIVHRLYPIGDQDMPAEFLAAVREINRSMNAIPPEKIKNAREVILIAGDRQKLNALYELLSGGCPEAPITKSNLTLVTDSWTASTVLQRMNQQPA